MSRASRQGRDAAGRYYPGKALRLKVHLRCANCGRDLFQREVLRTLPWHPRWGGDRVHKDPHRLNRYCGPVYAAPNPRYRQA